MFISRRFSNFSCHGIFFGKSFFLPIWQEYPLQHNKEWSNWMKNVDGEKADISNIKRIIWYDDDDICRLSKVKKTTRVFWWCDMIIWWLFVRWYRQQKIINGSFVFQMIIHFALLKNCRSSNVVETKMQFFTYKVLQSYARCNSFESQKTQKYITRTNVSIFIV